MSPRMIIVSFVLSVGSSAGWTQTDTTSRPPTVRELEKKLESIEARLSSLQGRVSYRLAALDCNSGKYDEFLLDAGNLTFFAACKKIEPYLEGHRVTISVGNPYAFTFRNIKGKLGYGKDFSTALVNEVDINTQEPLRAGSWNTIVITVNPSKPEEMRSILLQMSADTASAL